jgi:LuxR family transcriptional regulator, maltose regulon positive regulatory protein
LQSRLINVNKKESVDPPSNEITGAALSFKIKSVLPPTRPNLVTRHHLFDRLTDGLLAGRGLTLVSAPAGYGKSVLAAEWVRNLQKNYKTLQVSWLSLDDSDTSPERFFAYLAALFLEKQPEVGFRFDASEEDDPLPESLTALLDEIIIQLFARGKKIDNTPGNDHILCVKNILILDDYHRINSGIIHRAVQYLLDHSHPNLHILLITRVDPPLHLSRLRAHAELTEIRMRDLAFSLTEAAELINTILETDLRPEWILALTERTEGWAVGLQLAAVSLRQSSDIAGFISDFKGSHRYLVDYLVDEVLKTQPDQVRLFLEQTSPLKYFNNELCSIITGRELPGDMLSRIEKANLFLIPLDENREWYRYHHLFADCLKRQLKPGEKKKVLVIASEWSEKKGYIPDAVEYALATGDFNIAADTLERALKNPATWSSGYLTMLEDWFDKLPHDCVNCRPDLQIMASRTLFLTGKIEESELLLDQGERILNSNPPDDPTSIKTLRATISIYRSALAAIKGELARARKMISPAMEKLSPEQVHITARGWDIMGLIDELAGNLEDSYHSYLKASYYASKARVLYLAVNALCEAAMIRLMQGSLSEAKNNCIVALSLAAEDKNTLPPAGMAWAILGEISREKNEIDQAETNISQGLELALKGGIVDDLRQIFYYQVQLQASIHNYKALNEATGSLARILESYRIKRLSNRSEAIKARTAMLQGDLHYADSWAERYEKFLLENSLEYIADYEKLTLARVRLSGNHFQKTIELCAEIIKESLSGGRARTSMEALILHAQAAWNSGLRQESEKCLSQALTMAAPEGYIRLFIDAGPELKFMIEQLLPSIKEAPIKRFGLKLINAFEANQPAAKNPDTLSLQETRILELIADGLSNKEIAGKLFISLGTAKWHAHNIYEKLGVNSRTQAIAKGRELNIIAPPEKG